MDKYFLTCPRGLEEVTKNKYLVMLMNLSKLIKGAFISMVI